MRDEPAPVADYRLGNPGWVADVPWLAQLPWSVVRLHRCGEQYLQLSGGAFELAVRASGNTYYRLGSAAAIATAFLLVWINLAVGIIGSENNPLNLMFFGVIAAALVAGIVARFEADGMARAMIVAAVLQALIGVAAFLFDAAKTEPPGPIALLLLIEFFAAAWLASAWLFRKAAQQ